SARNCSSSASAARRATCASAGVSRRSPVAGSTTRRRPASTRSSSPRSWLASSASPLVPPAAGARDTMYPWPRKERLGARVHEGRAHAVQLLGPVRFHHVRLEPQCDDGLLCTSRPRLLQLSHIEYRLRSQKALEGEFPQGLGLEQLFQYYVDPLTDED